nr:inner centromere protein isoform X2 [Pogona vitticeps]
MVSLVNLEKEAQKKLEDFLQNVHNRDFLWMDEILEEAIKISNSNSSGEPLLMPKTPSQKNRQKKKHLSSVKKDQFSKKRLSKRYSTRSSSSKQTGQNLQHRKDSDMMIDAETSSPCHRVTRSRAMRSARPSQDSFKKLSIDLTKGRIPLVEISANERHSAELQVKQSSPLTGSVARSITLLSNGKSPIKESQPLSKASLIVIPDTPETNITKEGRGASKMKIANMSIPKTPEKKEATTQQENICDQQQEDCKSCETEAAQNLAESPQTPTAPKANRRSVRRSLMGRRSMNSKASLVETYSLSIQRERMVRKSVTRSLSKRKKGQQSSAASQMISEKLVAEEASESGLKLDPNSEETVVENPRISLRSHKASMTTALQPQGDQAGGECKDDTSQKCEDMQKQPQIIKRQSSYKRALDINDEQYAEEKLSPPRKKAPSPQCLTNKVSRPFKTFLHTVHKNQVLMMTPGSVSRNNTIKSFLKQNTPLRTPAQGGFVEKERQRFENLRKKEEAEQQRRQKLEEEKRRRLEEMKRKRAERLRKVAQAREQAERLEEEKKKRFEQKHAQHEEKHEKVREDKLAEDKIKKKAVAKKLEDLEARRKQEDEARKQRALQLKRQEEEEQEKARKIADQRRAELEREKKLSAERELQRKKEQEKLQAQQEHERQEKEKAARLQREVLAAAKEKERLRKELEEKERKLEQQKQEELQLKASSGAEAKANKQMNVTISVENSPACNSYPMTPQGPKQPKLDLNNYGMDLNSDDSTDDENQPRKPIPAWAMGNQLSQAIIHQYYNPPDTRALFGVVNSPKLEEIFYKSKPRYFKRTSSAVWNSPPFPGGKSVTSALKRY